MFSRFRNRINHSPDDESVGGNPTDESQHSHHHHRGNRHHEHRHGLPEGATRLSDLLPGQHGRVMQIGGSEHFRIRLMEMGLLVNDTVEVDKYAPLQDPMELIVKGYHLSLRRMDADKIMVELLD